jgi:hypothetical protein
MEIYKRLFGIFAPQFSAPSEDFEKQNRRDAILAAGAAMLSGGDLMEGMGRAGQAFGQQMYDRRQDEQRRLDLRSREDALSRYRAASAAGVGQEKEQDYELTKDPAMLRWLEQWKIRRAAELEDKANEPPDVREPYDPATDIPTQRAVHLDSLGIRNPGQAPPEVGDARYDRLINTLAEGYIARKATGLREDDVEGRNEIMRMNILLDEGLTGAQEILWQAAAEILGRLPSNTDEAIQVVMGGGQPVGKGAPDWGPQGNP